VAALGNNTVEILDTRNKERRTLSGLGEPQGVLYLIAPDRLFIANGAANRVDIVDLTSLAEERRITGMNDALDDGDIGYTILTASATSGGSHSS